LLQGGYYTPEILRNYDLTHLLKARNPPASSKGKKKDVTQVFLLLTITNYEIKE